MAHECHRARPSLAKLKETLKAGRIPVTDKAIDDLRIGLGTIDRGYRLEEARTAAKPDAELRQTLLKLHASLDTTMDILNTDLSGPGQIEALLSHGPWRRDRVRQYLDATQGLLTDLGPVCQALSHELAAQPKKKRHQQNSTTWFMLAVHDLFSQITENPVPGIAARLHRFTQQCAALVDPNLVIPENEDSFRKRLNAALGRRNTGKITVSPIQVLPRKN
jgi:hypothetical protein